jgi:MoaA/NifB/PqqE/SkfB family radical SAM enzyme
MYNYSDIKQIHLEVTQNCQAACPMCDRNMNGEGINPHIDLSELTLEDCERIFTPEFIAQLDSMYMCGNLGDPCIAQDTLKIFQYFRKHNKDMWLSMNTNGGAQNGAWWAAIADTFAKKGAVIFSVDGLKDTNHIYRQGVTWDLVERNMRAFVNGGGRARWDYLIFEHNQHQVDQARALAEDIGCENFIAKKTARFVTASTQPKESHQAVSRKGTDSAELKKPDDKYVNKALTAQQSLLEKYGNMDNYYDVVPINCKVKDAGNLFISAEGLALPCCWTAGRMYKWWHKDPRVEQIWTFIELCGGKDKLNAKLNGLEAVFDTGIFDMIEKSWAIEGCSNGKLKVCSMKCGVEWDPFTEQFK